MKKFKKWLKKRKILKAEKKAEKERIEFMSQFNTCGEGLDLFGVPEILFPKHISVGNNLKINKDVYINARSGVTIGDNVTLSYGAKIISTGYDIDTWMETGKRIHKEDTPVHIGNNCWVGAGAIILPGVQITGEYVLIGAGAVVTKDITESKVLVAGNPARIIKHYDK
ncbi:MAG: hypothetical protein IKB88_01785 [Clostridia bacterium]|nr:hypothetical protein [Clostridia bacterium]